MNDIYFGHIRKNEADVFNQTLIEHCKNAANYAKDALSDVCLSDSAYLAGLLHDIGKATQTFQRYLNDSVFKGNVTRGSVNHTFAAVRFLLNIYHDNDKWGDYAPLTSELLAYAAGAHHGLFDCVDAKSESGFQHRLDKEGINYDEAIEGFFDSCVEKEEIDELFSKSMNEVKNIYEQFPSMSTDPNVIMFFLALLTRLLGSVVIEGDRRDTAEFMNNTKFPIQPETEDELAQFWKKLSDRVNDKLDMLCTDTSIAEARRAISQACLDFAEHPTGVYRLSVPTGSGKTLSSLRFALAHAAHLKKKRVIFVSPLLSILDQNADVIRNYIQDNSLILEHHSNVIRSTKTDDKDDDELDIADLLTATWQSPIIITTLVQLLNTMFDGNGSCIRRFNALCNSVIVIDEVQTVPNNLLSLFNLAISFLAETCNTTIVLCSATQPSSEAADHSILVPVEEMVPYDPELWRAFDRTYLEDKGRLSLCEIPELAAEILKSAESLLIVCNKKSEAESLYGAIPETYEKFHLSAAMCMAHRREVLSKLQKALDCHDGKKKVVCVSTQVIEAGVDISFSRVIRLAAGLDSVVQSAGRCNRNGESVQAVPVYLVQCCDEDLSHLREIKDAKGALLELLEEYKNDPKKYECSLTSNKSIDYYYNRLYKEMPKGYQDGSVNVSGKITTLFSLLSDNKHFIDLSLSSDYVGFCLRQAFKTAGRLFAVFDDNKIDILVPYKKGEEIILDLNSASCLYDIKEAKNLLEEAKLYTVSLYEWQKERLESEHALESLCDGRVLALKKEYYDNELGFCAQAKRMEFVNV